jgi:hypothetical protein
MTKREFDKLSAAQIVAVDRVLGVRVIRTGPESCIYEDGWDDARVAREVIPEYAGNGMTSVGRLRISLGYGKLRNGRKPDEAADPIEAAYRDLDARITAIEKALFA